MVNVSIAKDGSVLLEVSTSARSRVGQYFRNALAEIPGEAQTATLEVLDRLDDTTEPFPIAADVIPVIAAYLTGRPLVDIRERWSAIPHEQPASIRILTLLAALQQEDGRRMRTQAEFLKALSGEGDAGDPERKGPQDQTVVPTTSFANGHLTVLSTGSYHALREALSKNKFRKVDGTPWPTASLDKGNARGEAQLRPVAADDMPLMSPEEEARWASIMWKQREELSDLDADSLDALSALWLHQAKTPLDDAVAAVDQLLAMRGIKPKRGGSGGRGGYESEQRGAMLKALSHIQNIWMNMAEVEVYESNPDGKSRQRVKQTIQSRPFVITDRLGQLRMDGYMDVRRFIFRPGRVFAHFLMGPGRQTALLSARALHYDPYRQVWEKRLARYLSWQWRSHAHHGNCTRAYCVDTLLEAVGEALNARNPDRTRGRLEKALDTLRDDGVIAAWQYDRWDEDTAGRRKWGPLWLEATVLVEPPEEVQEHYRSLERRERVIVPNVECETLGARLRATRNARELSQLQAAEQMGISQAYLSLLERGKVTEERLSASLRLRVMRWLG